MMMYGYGMGGLGILMMLLFAGLVIGLIVWLVTVVSRNSSPSTPIAGTTPPQPPLDIAQRRYARGEITKAEYEEIRNALSGA